MSEPRTSGGASRPSVQVGWILAAVAVLAAVVFAGLWRSAVDDRDAEAARADDLQAELDEIAAAEAALPDLAELAADTFSDDGDWSGGPEFVTVTLEGVGVLRMGELEDYLSELGFSRAVSERMGRTRALDGTQSASGTKVNATWTYHPDNGLQVVFERE